MIRVIPRRGAYSVSIAKNRQRSAMKNIYLPPPFKNTEPTAEQKYRLSAATAALPVLIQFIMSFVLILIISVIYYFAASGANIGLITQSKELETIIDMVMYLIIFTPFFAFCFHTMWFRRRLSG